MIKEFEIYHGIAFTRMTQLAPRPFSIQSIPGKNNSSYVIDGKAALYIKYCTTRRSPWRFTFTKSHQEEIHKLHQKFGQVFVLLVCFQDGIVALNYEELKSILDDHYEETEWVSASRRKREMYTLKGKNGLLDFKVGDKDYPKKIFEFLDK